MSDDSGKYRLQVPVSDEALAKIDELAEALGRSRASVAAQLLEEGLNDNEWIIRNIAVPVRRVVDAWQKRGQAKGRRSTS